MKGDHITYHIDERRIIPPHDRHSFGLHANFLASGKEDHSFSRRYLVCSLREERENSVPECDRTHSQTPRDSFSRVMGQTLRLAHVQSFVIWLRSHDLSTIITLVTPEACGFIGRLSTFSLPPYFSLSFSFSQQRQSSVQATPSYCVDTGNPRDNRDTRTRNRL